MIYEFNWQTNGQINLAGNSTGYSNKVVNLGNAQGGPLSPANAVINLGNQGEQYGARLDRTVQDSIALSNRVQEAQKFLTESWGSIKFYSNCFTIATDATNFQRARLPRRSHYSTNRMA